MDREEYKKFMTYLFREYVSGRNSQWWKRIHPMERFELTWEWQKLRTAIHTIRYINRFCDDEEDIYKTFTPERIERLPREVLNGLRANRNMSDLAGFLDALDAHYEEVIEGMTYEDMPPQELEVLRALGSEDPETELRALIHIVKSRRRATRDYDQELHLSKRLKDIEDKLESQCKNLEELKESAEQHPNTSQH